MDYLKSFEKAIIKSKELDLIVPNFISNEHQYLDKATITNIQKLLTINKPSAEDIFKQCFRFHAEIRQPLELLLQTKIFYTIGYVTVENDEFFKTTYDELSSLLKTKIKKPLSAHAWLTLPSMEIIDFTFTSTYLMKTGEFDGNLHVITKHADSLTGNMKYHPMLIGTDFLFKSGAIKGNPSWV
ncbi:hypothetical protein MHTCC0001_30660 [Flavobacteriaceae bacterium MHTCC 0001]